MRNKTIQQQNCNKAIKETTTKISQSGPLLTQNKKKNWLWKDKNVAVNKQRVKITWRCNKIRYISEKYFIKKLFKDVNYRKVRDHCHYTERYRRLAHGICNSKFNVPNEIPVVVHNNSKYDYHFIIKELANEFEGSFKCIGENSEIYKIFSDIVNKKVIKTDKDSNEMVETISCKIKFIDSMRFVATLLSKLVDSLTEGIQKLNAKIVIVFLNMKLLRIIW